MYTIGQFAAFGHISARRLRHYDAIGLLQPAHVDERTGYRLYTPDQLPTLLRIAMLRDLGCPLAEIRRVVNHSDEELAVRVALRRRQKALEAALAADAVQLQQVTEQLDHLEGRSAASVIYKSIDAVTVYAASAIASGGEGISGAIASCLWPLRQALDSAGVDYREPTIFWYEPLGESGDVKVWVSWTAGPSPVYGDGWLVVHLPPIERAASLVHRGDMKDIARTWRRLASVAADAGEIFDGITREVCVAWRGLEESDWLTEVQQPLLPWPTGDRSASPKTTERRRR
jgi:DNA-binding transcriptional MerR regulator